MMSENDKGIYTVHEVCRDDRSQLTRPVEKEGLEDTSLSPERYYPLGTKERHAFDEHMRRLRQKAVLVEKQRLFRVSHPFQPNTTTPPSHTQDTVTDKAQANVQTPLERPIPSGVGPSSSPSNRRPVFDRLAAQALQLEMRRRHREEQQRRAEAAALHGAFQPQINNRAPIYVERLRHLDSVRVEDRLLRYGELVARERQRKQELTDLEDTLAWQSAQASLVGSGAAQTQSLEDRRRQQEEFQARNTRFLAERSKHRQRAEAAAAEAFPFHPKISATSASLDEARQRWAGNAGAGKLSELLSRSVDTPGVEVSKATTNGSRRSDALYALAVSRQRHRIQNIDQSGAARHASNEIVDKANALGDSGATHQPVTNPTSDKWIAKGAHGPFFRESFVHRQSLYEEVKREEAELRATAMQTQECSGERALVHKVDARELTQRLYYNAKRVSEDTGRRRQASVSAQECPFRPQLSPGTKYVLRHMPSRDGDVVTRLTCQHGRSASRGVRTAADSDLYRPSPHRRLPLQPISQSPSQQRQSVENSCKEVVTSPSQEKHRPPSRSPRRETRVATTNGSGDELPQQGQRRQNRLILTRDQIDSFYLRQMTAVQERQDSIQERKESEAAQELVDCTFRPRTNTNRHVDVEGAGSAVKSTAASVKLVTGVSEFLERQALARMRKTEHDELVRAIGLPRNKGAVNSSASAGTTILSPFKLETENRRKHSPGSLTCASSLPPETRKIHDPGSISLAALTTAERALCDAIEESRSHPRSGPQAPFFPLPGYLPEKKEAQHLGGAHHPEAHADRPVKLAATKPPPILPAEDEGWDRAYTVGPGNERVSLFSLISPNAFSGRSLDTVSVDCRNERSAFAARDIKRDSVSPSALKSASASARRRNPHRSVSFAEERSEAPLAEIAHKGRNSYADPTHLAFLNGGL